MFQHGDLAGGASDLTPNLTRDDKARLWAEATCRLNHLGSPRTTERWKRVWFNRVGKARKRSAVVEAERVPGGGVQSVGAPAEEHPDSQDAGEAFEEEAEEEVDREASTSTQMPQPRAQQATVRPRWPHQVPRVSQQEQRVEVAFSAVANQRRLLEANVGRDTRDEKFQEQITLGMGQLLEWLDQLAQNVGQQTQSMDWIVQNTRECVLSIQESAVFVREVILLLSSHALRQPQPQPQPQAEHLAQPPPEDDN
ncbi:uncharacterized protein ISCGN_026982 [Ixodes scapularis]